MTAYATIYEAKSHGGITDTARDDDLSRLLLAASRAIDRAIGVADGAFAASPMSSRTVFLISPAYSLVLEDFIYSLSGVFYRSSEAGPEEDRTAQVIPAVARLGASFPCRVLIRKDRLPFEAGWWRVAASWGVSASPPPDIVQATIILALHWLRQGPSHYAVETLAAMEGRVVAMDQIPETVREVIRSWQARLGTIP